MGDHIKVERYHHAIGALADDITKLDAASAHEVIEKARELARIAWLREQIREGEDSGEPLDGPTVMAELRARAIKRMAGESDA